MAAAAVKGLDQAVGLIERLPGDARTRLGFLLARMGEDISGQQQRAVAVATGNLKAGLDFAVQLDELRLRAGLLTFKAGRNSRYYGRFVEFGRRAQTVRVTRGTSASRKSASTRRRLRKGLAVREPYTLRVTALPARPFVHLPGLDLFAARRLARFWSEVLG